MVNKILPSNINTKTLSYLRTSESKNTIAFFEQKIMVAESSGMDQHLN
jgi:hypothetical protein